MLFGPAAEQQYANSAWLFSGQNAVSPEHCKITPAKGLLFVLTEAFRK